MREKWPRDEITAELRSMMGIDKQKVDDPLQLLTRSETLLNTLAREIYLPKETHPANLNELALQILRQVVRQDESPNVQMARELIAISAYEPAEVTEILAKARDSRVRPSDLRRGTRAKSCRQYLAGYGQHPPLSASRVGRLPGELLPNALNDALFKYIDKNLTAAQELARAIGLAPQSPEDAIERQVTDPLAPGSQDTLLDLSADGDREPYVRRSSIEAQFRRLRHDQAGVICFIGPPAMGKTKLAEEFTRTEKHPDGVTIRIDAGSNEQLERSLHDVLSTPSSEPAPSGLPALEAAFRGHVLASSPWYVLIDNVSDSGLLNRLIPHGAKTTLIVTANRRLDGIPAEQCIEVERLEPHESTELILAVLPGVTKDDADGLAATLDHHPLAITAACGMLAQDSSISISGFCTGLDRAAATIFDGVADDGQRNLTSIYRQTLSSLNRVDPQAHLMLQLTALLGDGSVDSSILVLTLSHLSPYREMNLEQRKVIARRALRHLVDRFLIAISERGVRMHQLARAIVRELIADQSATHAKALLDGIHDVCGIVAEASRPINPTSLNTFSSMFSAVGEHLVSLCSNLYGRRDGSFESYVESIYEACARILVAMGVDASGLMVAVVTHSETSYRTMLMPLTGEPPAFAGFTLDRQQLERAAGPSKQFVTRAGTRTYTVREQQVTMPVILIARREDVE